MMTKLAPAGWDVCALIARQRAEQWNLPSLLSTEVHAVRKHPEYDHEVRIGK
jgi:hypothetical protein